MFIFKQVVLGAYGNKNTDAIAYCNSAIPNDRVFLLDENGCMVKVGDLSKTSYEEHATNIDVMYPKIKGPYPV